MQMWQLVFIALVIGFISGWLGSALEHIQLLRRVMAIDGLLRGMYAANARRARKVELQAAIDSVRMPTIPQTDAEILAAAKRQGIIGE